MRDGGPNGGGASPLLNLSQGNGSGLIGDGGAVFMLIKIFGGFQRSAHWQILLPRSKVEVWL